MYVLNSVMFRACKFRCSRRDILRCILCILAFLTVFYYFDIYAQILGESNERFELGDFKSLHAYHNCELSTELLSTGMTHFPKLVTIGSVWYSGLYLMGVLNKITAIIFLYTPHF